MKKSEKKSCCDVLLLLLVTFTLIDVFKNASFNLLVFYQICMYQFIPEIPGKSRNWENPDRSMFGKRKPGPTGVR